MSGESESFFSAFGEGSEAAVSSYADGFGDSEFEYRSAASFTDLSRQNSETNVVTNSNTKRGGGSHVESSHQTNDKVTIYSKIDLNYIFNVYRKKQKR